LHRTNNSGNESANGDRHTSVPLLRMHGYIVSDSRLSIFIEYVLVKVWKQNVLYYY